jgi:four helix bundle protein
MTNFGYLPYEKLVAYQEARKLLAAVREASISEARLRDQALRAAVSVCLNISEAAGRAGSADKARVYAIARGENCEVGAAIDIALAAGCCREEPARRAIMHARAVHALLSGLMRRFGKGDRET